MTQPWHDPTGLVPTPPLTTRFAPSPTGRLHLGHVYSALVAHDAAREAGGRFLLRIEDIDTARCRPEFIDGILEDLDWLGLGWDGEVLRQSDRFDLYHEFLHVLEESSLLYPCFCTRKEIQAEIAAAQSAPHGPDGPLYPGICKHLDWREAKRRVEAGEPHALRIHMDRAAGMAGPLTFADAHAGTVAVDAAQCGDVVLARKDTPTSYHLSVTVDDALQRVTMVTRGEELLPSTHIHRILQTLFALPEPAYRHHALISDADGVRLSKRQKSLTVAALREAGYTADRVKQMARPDQGAAAARYSPGLQA